MTRLIMTLLVLALLLRTLTWFLHSLVSVGIVVAICMLGYAVLDDQLAKKRGARRLVRR